MILMIFFEWFNRISLNFLLRKFFEKYSCKIHEFYEIFLCFTVFCCYFLFPLPFYLFSFFSPFFLFPSFFLIFPSFSFPFFFVGNFPLPCLRHCFDQNHWLVITNNIKIRAFLEINSQEVICLMPCVHYRTISLK